MSTHCDSVCCRRDRQLFGPALGFSTSEIKVANATACGRSPGWRRVEVQVQSLEPWRYASKESIQIGNQQRGRAGDKLCSGTHTRKRQAACGITRSLTADVLADRYFARLYARTYLLLARHGSIEQDRTSNGPEGWIVCHTGSVSGLRGCSPQVPAVAVDEPRIFLSRS